MWRRRCWEPVTQDWEVLTRTLRLVSCSETAVRTHRCQWCRVGARVESFAPARRAHGLTLQCGSREGRQGAKRGPPSRSLTSEGERAPWGGRACGQRQGSQARRAGEDDSGGRSGPQPGAVGRSGGGSRGQPSLGTVRRRRHPGPRSPASAGPAPGRLPPASQEGAYTPPPQNLL